VSIIDTAHVQITELADTLAIAWQEERGEAREALAAAIALLASVQGALAKAARTKGLRVVP
jgi:hypothetical protein